MNLSEQQPASCDWWWKVGRYEHVCDEGCRQQNLTAGLADMRIEAAVSAMDGYYQDREWPAPGLAVVEAIMREVFAAADAADPVRAALNRVREAMRHPHKGPNDTDVSMLLEAAKRLDGGYQVGGSNTQATVAAVLRAAAALEG